jgi:hypothetical protein
MTHNPKMPPAISIEKIDYIKRVLAELSILAKDAEADMLLYLLQMAFTEADDIKKGKVALPTAC